MPSRYVARKAADSSGVPRRGGREGEGEREREREGAHARRPRPTDVSRPSDYGQTTPHGAMVPSYSEHSGIFGVALWQSVHAPAAPSALVFGATSWFRSM